MKTRDWRWVFCLLAPLWLVGGCATKALWKDAPLDAYNEPDDFPGVRLFEAKSNDVLVIYREYSERHDYTRTRAYLLNQNQKRVAAHRRPHFVGTNWLSGMTLIPLLSETNLPATALPPKPYATIATNGLAFQLFSAEAETNTYELPVYNDGRGKWERIVLTPITVAADITIVGGFIGYLWLHGMAESGGSASPP
jgi:hypothetical protein